MHGFLLLLPTEGKRLPTSRELRRAGFMVSTAMAVEGETKEGKGPIPAVREENSSERKQD
ncbi:hypothetical protein [Pseudodesulfovibrio sp.]|uniref:hypothetical protein n=1 Tax=unclassified Pseudodesulfovibrio TaxID=2661612 RepID=UPI003AFFBB8D